MNPEPLEPPKTGLPQVYVPADPIALLYVTGIAGHGNCYLVSSAFRPVTAGRSKECDLVLADDAVSRHQFRIDIEPAASATPGRSRCEFMLIDAESKGGTLVNCSRATEIRLNNGNFIQVGRASLRFPKLEG